MQSLRRSKRVWAAVVTVPFLLAAGCSSDGDGSGDPSGPGSSSSGPGTGGGPGIGGAGNTGGAGGAGGAGGDAGNAATGGQGGAGGQGGSGGGSSVCNPGTSEFCYSGPPGTETTGLCRAGLRQCLEDGSGFGPCEGEVTPVPETCATPGDDDCDGQINEEGADCQCLPGTSLPCYSGPAGTLGVGACVGGTQVCQNSGTSYGPCMGEVVPLPETCLTPVDDDCDGVVNEEGAGCVCVPNTTSSCYSGPPGTVNVGNCMAGVRACNAKGMAWGPCIGEVLPQTETCLQPGDEDCDGQINESGEGCVCVPGSVVRSERFSIEVFLFIVCVCGLRRVKWLPRVGRHHICVLDPTLLAPIICLRRRPERFAVHLFVHVRHPTSGILLNLHRLRSRHRLIVSHRPGGGPDPLPCCA